MEVRRRFVERDPDELRFSALALSAAWLARNANTEHCVTDNKN